jgi:exopolysaccharide production protein ExoZ
MAPHDGRMNARLMSNSSANPAPNVRLHGLDYLRGLSALGIMVYHYTTWTWGEHTPGSFLGRVGIYGVAVFYVLSGITLSYIYAAKLTLRRADLIDFYTKRFFRIFPLLWFATVISILLSKKAPHIPDLLLNLTGLFGFVKWNTYFATGAWSIGNELTFYLAFPVLVLLLRRGKLGIIVAIGIPVLLFLYFAFFLLQVDTPLASQWHIYTNPLNQFALFAGGVVIGRFLPPPSINTRRSLLAGIMGFALLMIVPVPGISSELVVGFTRVLLSVSCLLLGYGFFRTERAPVYLDKPLALLGQASYSLYLLHPILYAVSKAFFLILFKISRGNYIFNNQYILFTTQIVSSLCVSYFSYHYFERYFIGLGHRYKH